MSSPVYIVPHDFSEVADKAVYQALRIAKRSNGKVALLHVVDSKAKVTPAEDKLKQIIARFKKEYPDASMYALSKKGSIFTDIAKTAEEYKASLIIMGTHGAKGMQKVFGSFAIKVIASTHVPFMVVQTGRKTENIDSIVFPVDINVESLQILETALYMAKAFGAKIHLVAEDHSDKGYASRIQTRMKVVLKKFKEEGIDYEAEFLSGRDSFQQKIIDYGKKINASMFAATYDSDKLLASLDKFTQTLITNELGRPCVVIHSQNATKGFF